MVVKKLFEGLTFLFLFVLFCFFSFPNFSYAMNCPGAKQGLYQGVYGVWSTSDYSYLASHGVNWMIVEIWDYDPVKGLESLNAAADNNMKVAFVIIQRGEFGSSSFTLSEADKRFKRFFNYTIPLNNKYVPGKELKYHPALAANYPYSMNHQVLDDWANGTSKINVLVTEHRKRIYEFNKEVTMRDDGTWVPLLVHYRSVIQMEKYDNWQGDGIKRGFEAGEADIALLHDYPLFYTHEGDNDPSTGPAEEMLAFFERERDYIKARDPNTKINMLLGATVGGSMPTPTNFEQWACMLAKSGGAEAISWWPWRHGQYATQLGSQSQGGYMFPEQHCALYNIAATFIPGWLRQNSPNSPGHCPTIPIETVQPSSSPGTTLGDANGDSRVDGLDYVIWVDNYGMSGGANISNGDFNGDSRVDGLDFVIWVDNYGT